MPGTVSADLVAIARNRARTAAQEARRPISGDAEIVGAVVTPAVLTARHDRAFNLGAAGQSAAAAGLFASLVEDCARVLGVDHPDTLTGGLLTWGQVGSIGEERLLRGCCHDRSRAVS
ncbi:hypothetical protein ACWEQL_42100, partial [Kitasatospora sp. NPDC004240]